MRIQTKFEEPFPNACVIQVFTKKKERKQDRMNVHHKHSRNGDLMWAADAIWSCLLTDWISQKPAIKFYLEVLRLFFKHFCFRNGLLDEKKESGNGESWHGELLLHSAHPILSSKYSYKTVPGQPVCAGPSHDCFPSSLSPSRP